MNLMDISNNDILTPSLIIYFIDNKKNKKYKNPEELVFLYIKDNKHIFQNIENIKIFYNIIEKVKITKTCFYNLIVYGSEEVINYLMKFDLIIDSYDILCNFSNDYQLFIVISDYKYKLNFIKKYETELLIEYMVDQNRWKFSNEIKRFINLLSK